MLSTATTKRIVRYGASVLAAFAALLAAGIFLWGEYYRTTTFTDVPADRVTLIDFTQSYSSIADVERHLNEANIKHAVNRPPPSASTSRPPFLVGTIEIAGFTHLGVAGNLELSFFNDRLAAARFFPTDQSEYLRKLKQDLRVDLIAASSVAPQQNLRIATGSESARGSYVEWSDVRLDEEMSLWIKRYAELDHRKSASSSARLVAHTL
jgi:hypothetical protein